MEKIQFKTLNGLIIEGRVINQYPRGFLVFAQERIAFVDFEYKEIYSLDIKNLIDSFLN